MNLLSTTTKTGPSFSIAAMVSCPGKTKRQSCLHQVQEVPDRLSCLAYWTSLSDVQDTRQNS